jgi:hypothetical protein
MKRRVALMLVAAAMLAPRLAAACNSATVVLPTGSGGASTTTFNATSLSGPVLMTCLNFADVTGASLDTAAGTTATRGLGVQGITGGVPMPVVAPGNTSTTPDFVAPSTTAIFEVSPTTAANTASNPFFTSIVQGGNTAAVKAASTAPVAADPATVVTISPNCTICGFPDNSAFTFGSSGQSVFSGIGGVYQTSPTSNPVTAGNAGEVGLTHYRALMLDWFNTSGVEMGTTTSPVNTQPAAAISTTAGYGQSIPATWTTTAATYTSGQCLGTATAIAVTGDNGQSGLLTNLRVVSVTGLAAPVVVYVFQSSPTGTYTDHAACSVTATDTDREIAAPAAITLAAPVGSVLSDAEITYTPPRPFLAGGSSGSGVKTIWVLLVAGGSIVEPSTTDTHVNVGVFQN